MDEGVAEHLLLVVTHGETFVCNEASIRIVGLDAPETDFAKCDA